MKYRTGQIVRTVHGKVIGTIIGTKALSVGDTAVVVYKVLFDMGERDLMERDLELITGYEGQGQLFNPPHIEIFDEV